MKIRNKRVEKLLKKYKEISLLGKVEAVLGWDLNVNLPPKGSEGRSQQLAYLTELVTDKWLDKEFRKLLETAGRDKKSLNLEEAAVVRNLERGAHFYHRVPKRVIVEFTETSPKAYMAWQKAKDEDKFGDFLPHLKKLVRLNKIVAEHLGYKDNPYDALLDLYEPALTAKECKKMFKKLQPELTKILKKIKKSKGYKESVDLTKGNAFQEEDQKRLSFLVLKQMGYDLEAGGMDISSHPFTSELGRYDVRITNRYKPDDFQESLMVAMHEGGHALYEQGVNEEYEATPLEYGISLGIHESQSRFWENQIGRSKEFIKFMTPRLQAFYPKQLAKASVEEVFAHFNRVKAGLIRVEADEVTYNLHIILRFEIENALLNKKIKPEDLPEVWRAKMKKYLGVVPETDRQGVLQDVHWTHGPMGYFPTYTLGNLYAAQITETMRKELNVEDLSEKGELGTILSWLRTNVHQYGSLYWPDELIKKITGKRLSPRYFLTYINQKYSRIYSL